MADQQQQRGQGQGQGQHGGGRGGRGGSRMDDEFDDKVIHINRCAKVVYLLLGFADRNGFRCGTGFAYHLYDFENEKAYNFLETPLTVMDSALIREGQDNDQKINQILNDFINENRTNTKITFNFHNSRFFDSEVISIQLRTLYERLCEKIS